ncbi:MAG TPA: DUF485 domain-containing protein [Longimicrobiaceae bacterium]|nr:DUF485 domain-containing protein [Longimicrobiaceae bacterium]
MPDAAPPPPAAHPPPRDDWAAIEADPAFRELVAAKRRFIVPATVFFIVYYFALPVLVGYFPGVMDNDVVGNVNLAYLFALSQFFMAWAVMWLYVRRARKFDAIERRIVERYGQGGEG